MSRWRGWADDPEPLGVPIVDNHTHLDAIGDLLLPAPREGTGRPAETDDGGGPEGRGRPAVSPWTEGGHPSVADQVARARRAGVDRIVTVACDLDAIRWTDHLLRHSDARAAAPGPAGGSAAAATPGPTAADGPDLDGAVRSLLGAVAIHPNEATLHAGVDEVGPDGLAPHAEPRHAGVDLDAALAQVARVARSNDRVRAVGETGMDLFRTGPRGAAVQREAFRAHIALAKELGLPMQIHDRDAHREVLNVLAGDGAPEVTVFHCFSGDVEMARECVRRGYYLSFAGPLTFKPNDGLRAAFAAVPLGQVLLETDAPYLTPHPFRGRVNAPYAVAHTARVAAQVAGIALDELCTRVSATSEQLYGPW